MMVYMQERIHKVNVPKKRRVSIVPWMPSVSMLINGFKLRSINIKSFMGFRKWTSKLLAYYLFISLHASYDTTKALVAEANITKIDEGECRGRQQI
jgi:APA family basic amino acid/polyamine antiporter